MSIDGEPLTREELQDMVEAMQHRHTGNLLALTDKLVASLEAQCELHEQLHTMRLSKYEFMRKDMSRKHYLKVKRLREGWRRETGRRLDAERLLEGVETIAPARAPTGVVMAREQVQRNDE